VIPGFLIGPALGAGIAVAAWGYLALVHDPAVRAEMQAEISAAVTTERLRLEQLGSAALEAQAAATAESQAVRVVTRERIIRVPVTTACAAAPAVAAALDSLRRPAASTAAPPGAAQPARLPASAATS